MTPFIDIHTHSTTPSANDTITIRNYRVGYDDALPARPFSAGVHPWDAATVALSEAERFLNICDCVAIGEIGIDKSKEYTDSQTPMFEMQLSVAERRGLPIIIHCVKAFEEVMSILGKYELPAVIFHGYIGNRIQTARIAERGYFISAGTRSFASPKTVESLKHFPSDRLFLETDDSTATISDMYDSAAHLLGLESDNLKAILYDNFTKIFPRIRL